MKKQANKPRAKRIPVTEPAAGEPCEICGEVHTDEVKAAKADFDRTFPVLSSLHVPEFLDEQCKLILADRDERKSLGMKYTDPDDMAENVSEQFRKRIMPTMTPAQAQEACAELAGILVLVHARDMIRKNDGGDFIRRALAAVEKSLSAAGISPAQGSITLQA